MTRDEHCFRRALLLGFSFDEYPTAGRVVFHGPPPAADPADAAEVLRIRSHLAGHWSNMAPLIAVHLAEQRKSLPRFE